MDSPPPTVECRNKVTAGGQLTVGWGNNVRKAWKIVLDVLGLGEDGLPVPQDVQPAPQPNAPFQPMAMAAPSTFQALDEQPVRPRRVLRLMHMVGETPVHVEEGPIQVDETPLLASEQPEHYIVDEKPVRFNESDQCGQCGQGAEACVFFSM